jgi:hypothetical protein
MSVEEAAQWARILMHESQGLQIDPKTGKPTQPIDPQTGLPKSTALGVGQVLDGTFNDMAAKYGIKGSASDLLPNLQASAHYFHDLNTDPATGGLRNATMGYALGPTGAANVISGKSPLPADTADYLVKTKAPGSPGYAPVQVAGPGVPTSTTTPAPGSGERMVPDIVSGTSVPISIEQSALAAGMAGGPMAHQKVIDAYVQAKALQLQYHPTGVSGVQTSSTGETSAAPTGTQTLVAATPDERKTLFPQIPGWQDVLLKKDQQGNVVGYELPNMGPEKEIPISDEDARKPVEQGGMGNAYQPGAIYVRGDRTGLPRPMQMERQAGPPQGPTPGTAVMNTQNQEAQNQLAARATADPRINNFTQQLTSLGRINNLAADPTRTATDDLAALNTYFQFLNPGYQVHQEGPDAILETGGPGQRVQTTIAHLVGGRFLTPDTIQNVLNTVNTEAEGARAGFTVASNLYRGQAKARGLDPDAVIPDPEQVIQQYQQQWEASRKRLSQGAGVGGQTQVPGAAPTVRGGSGTQQQSNQQPAFVPPAQPGMLTPKGLQAMDGVGFGNLLEDVLKNTGRYNAADQAAVRAESIRRGYLKQ